MLRIIGAFVASYLAGAFPTAIITGKLLRGIDVRDHGSHNAGATNVWRVLGAGPAVFVLAVDALKGVAAVMLISHIGRGGPMDLPTVEVVCGLFAIVGHIWTVFAGFRGGKGVGTAAGVFAALAPWAVLAALVAFLIVVAITRYISAGSIAAATVLGLVVMVQRVAFAGTMPLATAIVAVVVALLIVVKHCSNIRRLLNGSENKFGRPATAAPPAAGKYAD